MNSGLTARCPAVGCEEGIFGKSNEDRKNVQGMWRKRMKVKCVRRV